MSQSPHARSVSELSLGATGARAWHGTVAVLTTELWRAQWAHGTGLVAEVMEGWGTAKEVAKEVETVI